MNQTMLALDLFGLDALFADGTQPKSEEDVRRCFYRSSGTYVNWATQEVIVSAAHVYADKDLVEYSVVLTGIASVLKASGMTNRQVARNMLCAMIDPEVQIAFGFHAHSPIDVANDTPLVPLHGGVRQRGRYTEENVLNSLVYPKLYLAGKHQLTDTILRCMEWLNDKNRDYGDVLEDNHWIVEIALSSLWNEKLRKTLNGLLGPKMPYLGPSTQRAAILRVLGVVLGVSQALVQHKLWIHNEGRLISDYGCSVEIKNWSSAANRAATYKWPAEISLILTQHPDDSTDFPVLPQTAIHQIQHYGMLDRRGLELCRFGITLNDEYACILILTNAAQEVLVFLEHAPYSGSGLVPVVAYCGHCDTEWRYDFLERKFLGLDHTPSGCCPTCDLPLDTGF